MAFSGSVLSSLAAHTTLNIKMTDTTLQKMDGFIAPFQDPFINLSFIS